MKIFTVPALLVAALIGAVASIPFLPGAHAGAQPFGLEVTLSSSQSGTVQVYYDRGDGFSEEDSSRAPLAMSGDLREYRLDLPVGKFTRFRFDPIDRSGRVAIGSAKVVGPGGRIVREIPLTDFQPLNQIESLARAPEGIAAQTTAAADDPQLLVNFKTPLVLSVTKSELFFAQLPSWLPEGGAVFAVLALLLWAFDRFAALRRFASDTWSQLAARPSRALSIVAALAVVASSYPVIFLGKSYVSPNVGTILLYDQMPTLPGYKETKSVDVKGSDTGAMMWQFVPFAMLQHRALAEAEWPVWNRDNSCGVPLLGQGYSMFGDPLHFIPVLANGASWAWDLKFLIAKWLFTLGIGLIVLSVTRHLPSAAIIALAGPFVGFFVYRVNHPAFFSFCYGPWALYCWLRAVRSESLKGTALWAAALILANFALINTGTVKEAYMILLVMNFAGLVVLLSDPAPWKRRLSRLALLAWAGVLFILFASPVWYTFIDTLKGAFTVYDEPSAFQIRPGILLGAFDEAFYRPLSKAGNVFNPSANFLILAGVLYFLATLRKNLGNRTVAALAIATLVPLSIVFGFVPASWLIRLPFIANISHIDNSFSCSLIPLWAVLGGAGFATGAKRLGTSEGRWDLIVAGLFLFVLLFNYVAFCQVVQRDVFGGDTTFAPLHSGESLPVSPFLKGYLVSLLAAVVAFGLLARRALAKGRVSAAEGLGFALCACLLLWRGGQQVEAMGFESYVMRPTLRTNFHARSEAVAFVQDSQRLAPARVVGLENNLFPGWTDAYGVEGISGPDALINPRYRELMAAAPLERVWDWRLYLTRDKLEAARPVLDFLNVRYYLDLPGDSRPLGPGFKEDLKADMEVIESPSAWPRAFFTNRLVVCNTVGDLMHQVTTGDGRPFASMNPTDLAANPEALRYVGAAETRSVVPASDYHLSENSTSFAVTAAEPGIAVLTEAWWVGYPHVEVDGKRAHLIRINHAFEGVEIPTAGSHRVTITYWPRRFTLTLVLSAISLLLMAASFAWICRRESKPAFAHA